MSVETNPDRIYVSREHRAMVRFDREPTDPRASLADVGVPGSGAELMDISAGGCCLRLPRFTIPADIGPGHFLSSIKLLHPELDHAPFKGRIAWSRDDPPYVFIGVQFTRIRSSTLESIRTYLRACGPGHEEA